jgi:hypothetical protein
MKRLVKSSRGPHPETRSVEPSPSTGSHYLSTPSPYASTSQFAPSHHISSVDDPDRSCSAIWTGAGDDGEIPEQEEANKASRGDDGTRGKVPLKFDAETSSVSPRPSSTSSLSWGLGRMKSFVSKGKKREGGGNSGREQSSLDRPARRVDGGSGDSSPVWPIAAGLFKTTRLSASPIK